MKVRRFEHPTKLRFWEIYWDGAGVEISVGKIGSNGRTVRRDLASPLACAELVTSEIAKRVKEGFEEVIPEVIRNATAPVATPPRELLERILEAPDEDQPRMVFADWLQTQGDPLGELIAVQLEIARVPQGKTVPKPLRDRQDNLLAAFRQRWLPNTVGADVRFVRGFVDSVRLETPFERELLDRVIDVSPLLRTLVFAHPRNTWPGQRRRPWEHASSRALQRLTGLFMSGFELDDAGLGALLGSPDLARLERLGLRSAQLVPSMFQRIVARDWIELDVHASSLGVRGVEYLVARPWERLVALDLGSNDITDDGVRLLTRARWPALQRLSVRRSQLTTRSVQLFASAQGFPALRELDVSTNQLDAEALRALKAALPAVQIVSRPRNVGY